MNYTYTITPRRLDAGGGWRLQLLEDGEEVGGGAFPLGPDNPAEGMEWWNAATEDERGRWLAVAGSARPVDAWQAFRLALAHDEADDEGRAWLSSRPQA